MSEQPDNYTDTRRSVLKKVGVASLASGVIGRGAEVSRATPEVCSESKFGTNCGGGGYPIQLHKYTGLIYDQGDLVTSVSSFRPYSSNGPDGTNQWNIKVQISSNASRKPITRSLRDEINTSTIGIWWDSSEGSIYNETGPQWRGATAETDWRSDYNYEDYADTAVEYGAGKLLGLVPYADELQAGYDLLKTMRHNMYGSEDGKYDSVEATFDWGPSPNQTNQVSYWKMFEAKMDSGGDAMTLNIIDRTDSEKDDTGLSMRNSFERTLHAPADSPDSVQVNSDEATVTRQNGWNYYSVPKEKIEENPKRHGFTNKQLDDMGDSILFAEPQKPEHAK